MPRLKITVLEAIQLSLVSRLLIPPPDLCSGNSHCLTYLPPFFHLSKLNPSFTWLQEAALCSVSMGLWRGRVPHPVTWPLLPLALASCPQLFLKEHLYQLLESMREHILNLAALTLQRCLRGFIIQRRFRSLRRKIILLQSRARGYLTRCSPDRAELPGAPWLGLGEAMPELR